MDNRGICHSRCAVGKGKWFWAMYLEEDYYRGNDPSAYGHATSEEATAAQAMTLANERYPDRDVEKMHAHQAEWFKRCLVAKEKATKRSNSTGTTQVEYVYRDNYDGDGSRPHRIVKKTAKKVFVDREPHSERFEERLYGDWRDFAFRRSIALDRQKLEKEGMAWSRAVRDYFYTSSWEERRHGYVPECGSSLGLAPPWTTDQVKQAFRRMARRAHPDAGGNSEEFKAVYRAYEQALRMAVEG